MLSKVAERVYWTARYLERVESTARLISIYDMLLFDLPKTVKISWYNLIVINSLENDFSDRYSVQEERNVVKFLLGDDTNPCSMLTSLASMRENIRTTRDVVLEETWEQVNELYLYVQNNVQNGIDRRQRHEFLDTVIKGCQQILGLLYCNMPHDPAWDFLRIGRNLERADMTSRNLDAGLAEMIELSDDEAAVNSRQIVWGNILRSLNAHQSYRRHVRSAVAGKAVLPYLLEDPDFPRSIAHCFNALLHSCERLPQSEHVVKQLKKIRRKIFRKMDYDMPASNIRDHINDTQIQLASIHNLVREQWFPIDY